MPKTPLRSQHNQDDAIAYRTRLRLGSTMHRTRPVQYPHNWPLLQEVERHDSNSERVNCSTDRPRIQTLGTHYNNLHNRTKYQVRKSTSQRHRKQRVQRKNQCLHSLIQKVTFRKHGKGQCRSTREKRRRSGTCRNRNRRADSRRGCKSKRAYTTYSRKKPTRNRRCSRKHSRYERYTRRQKLDYDDSLNQDDKYVFGPQSVAINDNPDLGSSSKNNSFRVGQRRRSLVHRYIAAPAETLNAQKDRARTAKMKRQTYERNRRGSMNDIANTRATKHYTRQGRDRGNNNVHHKTTSTVNRTRRTRPGQYENMNSNENRQVLYKCQHKVVRKIQRKRTPAKNSSSRCSQGDIADNDKQLPLLHEEATLSTEADRQQEMEPQQQIPSDDVQTQPQDEVFNNN